MHTQHLEIFVVILLFAGVHTQYQWSCSPLDTANNRYIIPDLGITDDGDVADNRFIISPPDSSVDYVFPVPSTLNCSGTVSALHYCYMGSNFGTRQLIVTLLILNQSSSTFTITDIIEVNSTPSSDICTGGFVPPFGTVQYCCDTLTLDTMHQFSLPAPNFAFGLVQNNLPAYNPALTSNFLVDHYRFLTTVIGTPTVGSTFVLGASSRVSDRTLRLLQFFMTPLQTTTNPQQLEESTTEAATSQQMEEPTEVTTPATPQQMVPVPAIEFDDQTPKEPEAITTPDIPEQTEQLTTGRPEAKANMQDSLIVGVIVGVACSLLMVVLMIVVLVLVKSRAKATINLHSETQDIKVVANDAYITNSTATDSQLHGSYEMTVTTSSTNIPVKGNAAYIQISSIPVEANAAYVTTPSIPVEANVAYTTADQLYATPRGEDGLTSLTAQQLTQSADYDYVQQ